MASLLALLLQYIRHKVSQLTMRQPKICNFGNVPIVPQRDEDDVVKFQIAVNDPVIVHVAGCVRNVSHEPVSRTGMRGEQ